MSLYFPEIRLILRIVLCEPIRGQLYSDHLTDSIE
jgi:hypothetical protein